MTSTACAEDSIIFMKQFNIFCWTKVQEHDNIINPNELYIMWWYFATVVRGLYENINPRMDVILPLLENLLIIYIALERNSKALLPS